MIILFSEQCDRRIPTASASLRRREENNSNQVIEIKFPMPGFLYFLLTLTEAFLPHSIIINKKETTLKKRKLKRIAPRLFGIDVSHHQQAIDWRRVANAGVKYAFLKATEASTFRDRRFIFNRANTAAMGIPSGGYHFFRPHSNVSAQIRNFVGAIGKLNLGELPPVLDLEVPESWRNLSMNQRTRIVRQWLDGVESALGVKPIIYLSSSFAGDVLGSQKWLQDYILWLAHYTRAANPRVPEPWKSGPGWTFWQYSETGRVDGINDNFVDLNWFNGSAEDLKKLLVSS